MGQQRTRTPRASGAGGRPEFLDGLGLDPRRLGAQCFYTIRGWLSGGQRPFLDGAMASIFSLHGCVCEATASFFEGFVCTRQLCGRASGFPGWGKVGGGRASGFSRRDWEDLESTRKRRGRASGTSRRGCNARIRRPIFLGGAGSAEGNVQFFLDGAKARRPFSLAACACVATALFF